jgi:hypothetical protein
MWMGDAVADATFVSTEQMLSERQIDFDIVNDDALAADLKPGHGTLETASGNSYRTVILPNISVLSKAALDRLRIFASTGGRVLFLGRAPSLISGKTILDARTPTPADFAWATIVQGELPPTPTPPAEPPTTPPTPQVVSDEIARAVHAAIPSEIALDKPDTALRFIHRSLKDAEVYLFFNEGPDATTHLVTLRGDAKRVEVWNPQTGNILAEKTKNSKGAVEVQLALKPYETAILVAR